MRKPPACRVAVWKQHVTCAGAAQSMFYLATAFNQPVAAWDVGQVTNMNVRRCLRLGCRGWDLAREGWDFVHACSTRGPSVAAQYMFLGNPLSDCNKLLIHTSFMAQTPSAWASSNSDSWASAWCNTPFLPPAFPPLPPLLLPPATPQTPSPPPPAPPGVFVHKSSLKIALGAWRNDTVSALETFGHISNWDVSAITDMSQLIGNSALRGDNSVHYEGYTYYYDIYEDNNWGNVEEVALPFEEDLNAWDVSRVTDMSVSCPGASWL